MQVENSNREILRHAKMYRTVLVTDDKDVYRGSRIRGKRFEQGIQRRS